MYNEKDREDIFNYLVDKFQQRKEVLGIIQIGSGSIGYKDIYSDLDFAIVIDETNINEVFNKTKLDIVSKYNIFFFDNMKERNLQLFLLDNYLELDIGYYTLESIYAKRKNYKIIYDKTGKLEEKMKNSWNEIKDKNNGTTAIVNMKEVISFIEKELWYNILHSVIAFKRGNKYRSYYELEQIKWYVIDLIAKRNNKESKRYRSLIELDKNEIKIIDKIFSYPANYNELYNYLNTAINIIFDEFDYWKNKEGINYTGNKEFYLKYIKDNN